MFYLFQNPLRVRLQVFKTERRGWGIRALNDIPAGGFICIYVGNLYSNDEANRYSRQYILEIVSDLLGCLQKKDTICINMYTILGKAKTSGMNILQN